MIAEALRPDGEPIFFNAAAQEFWRKNVGISVKIEIRLVKNRISFTPLALWSSRYFFIFVCSTVAIT